MTQQHQQNHATWECKYHVVFIPKYRKKAIFGVIKKRLGVNSGPKLAENQRFEIAARPHLAVDLLVANLSGTPCPVKAAAAEGGGRRPACVSDMSDSLGVKVPCVT